MGGVKNENYDSGVFKLTEFATQGLAGDSNGIFAWGKDVMFNARLCNSIYGRSSTVQPYSIKAKIYKRIG